MKRVWNHIAAMWQQYLIIVIVGLALSFLYMYRLGSLVPISTEERATISSSATLGRTIDNPINAPLKAGQYSIQKITKNPSATRFISVLATIISVGMFYYLARKLFTSHAAILGTIMLATSTIVLHNGRNSSGHITLLLALQALLASGYYLRYGNNSRRSWLLACLVTALSLYVPGMAYFVALGIFWQRKALLEHIMKLSRTFIALCGLAALVCLLPLIIALLRDPTLWRATLGLPAAFPSVGTVLVNIISAFSSLFAISPFHPATWLGRQPILDIFSVGIFLLGTYALGARYRLERTGLIAGFLLLGVLWISISNQHQNILLLIPLIYLVITAGLELLLGRWRQVFPRNPIARSLATVLLTLAVVVTTNFQLRRYFLAWPNNPETKKVLLK